MVYKTSEEDHRTVSTFSESDEGNNAETPVIEICTTLG